MSSVRWGVIKDLFRAALERPTDRRRAWLASVCADDAGVRTEVERLLAAHRDAGSFMEPSSDRLPEATAVRVDYSGRLFGRYRIGALIATGGMGDVYEAHDLEHGRAVAIKLLRSQHPNEQIRLRREARHAARLNHPHICTIHEAEGHRRTRGRGSAARWPRD